MLYFDVFIYLGTTMFIIIIFILYYCHKQSQEIQVSDTIGWFIDW